MPPGLQMNGRSAKLSEPSAALSRRNITLLHHHDRCQQAYGSLGKHFSHPHNICGLDSVPRNTILLQQLTRISTYDHDYEITTDDIYIITSLRFPSGGVNTLDIGEAFGRDTWFIPTNLEYFFFKPLPQPSHSSQPPSTWVLSPWLPSIQLLITSPASVQLEELPPSLGG